MKTTITLILAAVMVFTPASSDANEATNLDAVTKAVIVTIALGYTFDSNETTLEENGAALMSLSIAISPLIKGSSIMSNYDLLTSLWVEASELQHHGYSMQETQQKLLLILYKNRFFNQVIEK